MHGRYDWYHNINETFGTWASPASLLPALGGDVTGSYGATTVNTLGGGTLAVNQLVDLTTFQVLSNKNFDTEVYFSNKAKNRIFSVNLTYITGSSHTMLFPTSSNSRSIMLPDANDTLMCKETTDTMKNKTINDVSNTVFANGLRSGSTWALACGGAAPSFNDVLCYKGANLIWGNPTSMVTLAGDCTGVANNNVVSKATTDFAVGRILSCKTGVQTKKLVVHEGGIAGNVNDHDFQGFGTSDFIMRYQINATSRSHVFYAATSATASNELARISGEGDLSVARTISASNGNRVKKVVLYEGGTATDSGDHRYNGLGTSQNTLRYHVNSVTDNHVFYAANSATASNELLKIAGDGRTTVKMINSETWRDPNIQGAWMGWNKDNGSGRTTFANHMGLGYGGWNWINYNNSGVQTPAGNPAMSLDRDGNLTVRGRVISEGVPDAFSGNWWSANDNIMVITLPLHSSGQLYNTRSSITSINFSAWTNDANAIFLPVAGYFRISYRFKLSAKEKNNMMVKCNVSIGGTNHPSLYTFDMGFTFQHDLHCEAIVNISAPNMWVSCPKITVMNSSIATTAKDFDLFTGHFTIEKMK